MNYFTTNTYQMKREILNFSKKLKKTEQKLIADQLHEPIKKINTVNQLSKPLQKEIPKVALYNYLSLVKTVCPHNRIHCSHKQSTYCESLLQSLLFLSTRPSFHQFCYVFCHRTCQKTVWKCCFYHGS